VSRQLYTQRSIISRHEANKSIAFTNSRGRGGIARPYPIIRNEESSKISPVHARQPPSAVFKQRTNNLRKERKKRKTLLPPFVLPVSLSSSALALSQHPSGSICFIGPLISSSHALSFSLSLSLLLDFPSPRLLSSRHSSSSPFFPLVVSASSFHSRIRILDIFVVFPISSHLASSFLLSRLANSVVQRSVITEQVAASCCYETIGNFHPSTMTTDADDETFFYLARCLPKKSKFTRSFSVGQ